MSELIKEAIKTMSETDSLDMLKERLEIDPRAPRSGPISARRVAFKKKIVHSALHIRSSKAFMFCKECLTLKPSNLELTPVNLLSNFFCPTCQYEAMSRLEKVTSLIDDVKSYKSEEEILEALGNKIDKAKAIELIAKFKEEYKEWSDTQALTGGAFLYSAEDVKDIFAEIRIREFAKDDQIHVNKGESVQGDPISPYKALIRQLFIDLHRERVVHNENLEENIANKGF